MKFIKNVVYSFDPYTVEVAERRLWRGSELISLTPKALDTLIVLVAHQGKIVEKSTLFSEVWQDTFVEESTLAQNISTLRRILGEESNGKQFIETIPRRGYRFLPDVKEIEGDEEIIVVEHRLRTQISAEQEKTFDGTDVQPNIIPEKTAQKVPFAKHITNLLYQNRVLLAVSMVVLCSTLAAVWFVLRHISEPARQSSSRFVQSDVSRLTSAGNIYLVKTSPDGNYLALVEKHGEAFSLQLRQIENSTTIEIVPPRKQKFLGVTFSPNGKQIYYVVYENKDPSQENLAGVLYRVSTLGGQIEQIARDLDSPISISPDGRQFAFVRNYLNEKESAIVIAGFDNQDERKLATRRISDFFSSTGLAWSPDGKIIAAAASNAGTEMEILGFDTANGAQKPLTSEKWQWIGFPNWLSDGTGVIISAYSGRSGNQTDEIWEVSVPEGTARKISSGTSGIYGLSMTSDSRSLVAVESKLLSSFWVSPAQDLKQSVKIKQNLPDYNIALPGLAWTPDGKIIYGATLNGNLNIWLMDSDGSHNKQITNNEAASWMAVISADGQDIFFISNRTGKRNLWRMKTDGSGLRQLTDTDSVSSPSLSGDGKTVFYTVLDRSSLYPYLWRISIDGGESTQMTSSPTFLPRVSPDGKWIACFYPNDSAGDSSKGLRPTILSAETATVVRQWDTNIHDSLSSIAWSDNQNFNYIITENGSSRLWRQSIDKDSPSLILDLNDEKIFRFAWSTDGKELIYEKGSSINDILLIKSIDN